jgi:hypothetical protein
MHSAYIETIDGVLHHRVTEDSPWIKFTDKELTQVVEFATGQIKRLEKRLKQYETDLCHARWHVSNMSEALRIATDDGQMHG